jgi:hypothetical protein
MRKKIMKTLQSLFAVPALLIASMTAFGQTYPTCTSASSDPDGDGWGWENNQTCKVATQCNWYGATTPICTSTTIGWGWENNKSCISQTTCATAPNGLPSSSGSSSSAANQYPNCANSSSDPDGDGWGWENNATCQITQTPNCASAASDPDGDGWGWENNKSCKVVSGSGNNSTSTSCNTAPVNPNATIQARKVLCYIVNNYGNHILSGQQESTWIAGPEYEINYIYNKTGKYPAIRGFDFENIDGVADRAIAWWNAGGIPMIGYHIGAPNSADNYTGSQAYVNINLVLTSGTNENRVFLQRLDRAAAELQKLKNANVAVIWRPFHEAGGTWFWWSMEGGAQYKRLWNYMYNYYTNTKGLTNLVWLEGFNGNPDSSFYVGKNVVDIGGADTYAANGNYDAQQAMYNSTKNIVGSSMPIALHENGPIPDPSHLQSTGARWVLFNTWSGDWLMKSNSVSHLQSVYGSPYVITRDEVPNLK